MSMDRRGFLQKSAAVVVAGAQCFSGIPALAAYAAGPTIRRNAFNMAATDPILRGYRKAITAMRALPDDNPCSWFYQAAIHGTVDPRGLTAWNSCHTDPSFFWAWHRMYLYWFERIVRKYSGMYDWAIPYWDWTNAAQAALPPAFRDPASVLFDASRSASMNNGTGSISAATAASVASAMTLLDYFNTQSSINGPHGSVHVAVSGNMSSVSSAAQDPIFWLHHSQVDRLWNLWLAQGGGRSSPVSDTTWRNSTYTFFDECCHEVTMKGCDVLRAALQLSYQYEEEPAQVNQYCPIVLKPGRLVGIFAKWPRITELSRTAVRIPLIPEGEDRDLSTRLRRLARTRGKSPVLRIAGVEADRQPGVSWEVHVGAAGFRPGRRSLIGSFALFSGGLRTRKDHYHPAEFVFPLGRTVAAAKDPSRLEVVFVPSSGITGKGAESGKADAQVPLTIGELSILVDEPMPALANAEQIQMRREEAGQ